MRLNRAIIEDITFNGKLNDNDITGFINKLLHSNNLIAEVYIRNKCLLTSKVKFYIERQHVIASINKLFALDRTEISDNIVILIKEADIDNVIISSNTPTKNLLISMCDTEADLQFAVLSTNQYNIDDINIDKSRFIPIGDSRLSKINLDECKDLNGDIDPDEDVSVWKLSADPIYKFTTDDLVACSDISDPDFSVVYYNYDGNNVVYEDGMVLVCCRSQSSSWSNDIGSLAILNPSEYYGYLDDPDGTSGEPSLPTQNVNGYVCVAHYAWKPVSGVVIYKVKSTDVSVSVVNATKDTDNVLLLSYDKDGTKYYNPIMIDGEENIWVTAGDLLEDIMLSD